jgi:hypothetical protein
MHPAGKAEAGGQVRAHKFQIIEPRNMSSHGASPLFLFLLEKTEVICQMPTQGVTIALDFQNLW